MRLVAPPHAKGLDAIDAASLCLPIGIDMEDVRFEPVASRSAANYKKALTVSADMHDPEARALAGVEGAGIDVRNDLPSLFDRSERIPRPSIECGEVRDEHDWLRAAIGASQQADHVRARM
jgi:hypothetical protein